MNWLEHKYILLLSNRLLKFKRKSPVLFNMRCPFCGDSQKNKNKARGYIYQRSGKSFYSCHNCNESIVFSTFLKRFDSGLHRQYITELYEDKKSNKKDNNFYPEKKKQIDFDALSELKCIINLPPTHGARKYIEERKIPKRFVSQLYFCPEFKAWTNKQIPGKFESLEYEEERIIIPLYNYNNKMFGYQGRSLNPYSQIRYISIILDETKPKIWGLNTVDLNRRYYAFEGPFDAMCISNAIATAGGKITSELYKLNYGIENSVICYDNEPRNKDVVANTRKAVLANFNTVIWPSNNEYKDINEMVIDGISLNMIETFLQKHTFKGLEAELEFSKWRK
jgi:hypothetical protein